MYDKLPLVLGAYNSRLTKLCFVFGTDLDLCAPPPDLGTFAARFLVVLHSRGCHTSPHPSPRLVELLNIAAKNISRV